MKEKEKEENRTNEINVLSIIKPIPENKTEIQREHEDDDNELKDDGQKVTNENPVMRRIFGKP